MSVFDLAGRVHLSEGESTANWRWVVVWMSGVGVCVDELGRGKCVRSDASARCCVGQVGVEDGYGGSRYVKKTSGEGQDEVVIVVIQALRELF
jgi:hypothetical protein